MSNDDAKVTSLKVDAGFKYKRRAGQVFLTCKLGGFWHLVFEEGYVAISLVNEKAEYERFAIKKSDKDTTFLEEAVTVGGVPIGDVEMGAELLDTMGRR